ncbi:MAG: DUF4157 domain-containing protein [Bradymonadales bacterium]|nr:DUF4157 domain-containing protein [Bradymonadales bacterium]
MATEKTSSKQDVKIQAKPEVDEKLGTRLVQAKLSEPEAGWEATQTSTPTAGNIGWGTAIQRMADSAEVSSGAESAVAAAASSSGSPLPNAVQTKFESSLGVDLSSVRVHTDSTSATAAKSVHAKAYAMGQDIHFGAGQYNPSSPAGEKLLAHEVAHTVQQSSGVPRFKLEVSAPSDPVELEADLAAESMVEGQPTQLSIRRSKIFRSLSSVVEGGNEAYQDNLKNSPDEHHLQSAYASDRSQAEALLKSVQSSYTSLMDAQADSPLSNVGQMVAETKEAERVLQNYLSQAKTQDTMQGIFGPLVIKLAADYSRLMGMYSGAKQSLGIWSTENTMNKKAATDIASRGQTKIETQKEFSKQQKAVDPEMQNRVTNLTTNISTFMTGAKVKGEEAAKHGEDVKSGMDALNVATMFANLPAPEMAKDEDQKKLQGQIDNAKAQMAQVQTAINTAVSLAGLGLSQIKIGGGSVDLEGDKLRPISLKGDAGDVALLSKMRQELDKWGGVLKVDQMKSSGFIDGLADALTKCSQTVNAAQGAIQAIGAENVRRYMEAQTKDLVNKTDAIQTSVKRMRMAKIDQELNEAQLRSAILELKELIKGRTGGKDQPDFLIALSFQAEAQIFRSHLDEAIKIGRKEQAVAKEISSGNSQITNSREMGATYHCAAKIPTEGVSKGYFWSFTANKVFLSNQAQASADAQMGTILEQLEVDKANIEAFIKEISALTGIATGA